MIVGLMGPAGAGKSEVAKHLRENYGFQTPHIKAPFADMFRALLLHLGYSEEDATRFIDGDWKRKVVPELRITSTEAQQTLGTEWGRTCIRPSIWTDLWCLKADAIMSEGKSVALESVRFIDEANAVSKRGGLLIEVRRPGTGAINAHVSEAIPAPPDHILFNDGTIDQLRSRVDALIR